MGFLSGLFKPSFDRWLETASDQELADTYEQLRQEWMRTGQGGTGQKTPEMVMIDKEMSRRATARWEKDPRRSTDPNFRWTDANRWDRD